jgi:hypothetical protein
MLHLIFLQLARLVTYCLPSLIRSHKGISMDRELTTLMMLLKHVFIGQVFCRAYAILLQSLLDTLLYFFIVSRRGIDSMSIQVRNDYPTDELFELFDIMR